MTSARIATASNIKRGRGRPKGSLNKPKRIASPSRRNPPRQSAESSDSVENTCMSNQGLSLHTGKLRSDKWGDVQALGGHVKNLIAPYTKDWSNKERCAVANAFLEVALLCTPEKA
ncbi:hypothetical protein CF326_g8122 [Tilletia indica]|uniref:Uncharacterized protein n=1 Tax=Tilletia indica TaxID=43049 RepID=A0A177SXX5_9BASI|nr:hypothetical protein CF326_g8122 [Tilletia indica]KAE8237965.1 hypothetical protein A4X13_0g8570 [Tilletia indica]